MDLRPLSIGLASAENLRPEDAAVAKELIALWSDKRDRNLLRDRYYLGHVPIKDLGIAIPPEVAKKLRTRVDWPRKAVLALADRSQFDGFAASDDDVAAELLKISRANVLKTLYRRNLIGELKHCCGFWTVTDDGSGKPVISAYPATAACALWDDALKAIEAGLVVVESKAQTGSNRREPTKIDVFTATDVIAFRREPGARWTAEYRPHSMGRPLMEPMAYEPTLERPFGCSRITRTVMSLTDDAIRQRARMEVAAEASPLPQMWLLGTASKMTNEGNKYNASMGAINEITKDADGDAPTVWQSSQLSMQPHTEYFRSLASQFNAATSVPLSSLGVVSDNPSSAEAIYAEKEDLVIAAQNLNADNAQAMRNVALLALAIARGTDFASQRDSGVTINPRFRNPAMPSVVSQSDAVVKQVSAIPWIGETDVVLEELGYAEDQIDRMKSDKAKSQANAAVASLIAPKKEEEVGGDTAQPPGLADG